MNRDPSVDLSGRSKRSYHKIALRCTLWQLDSPRFCRPSLHTCTASIQGDFRNSMLARWWSALNGRGGTRYGRQQVYRQYCAFGKTGLGSSPPEHRRQEHVSAAERADRHSGAKWAPMSPPGPPRWASSTTSSAGSARPTIWRAAARPLWSRMVETAAILNQAGPRSFVILDEIGRGTVYRLKGMAAP
jgi:hypothetical protein